MKNSSFVVGLVVLTGVAVVAGGLTFQFLVHTTDIEIALEEALFGQSEETAIFEKERSEARLRAEEAVLAEEVLAVELVEAEEEAFVSFVGSDGPSPNVDEQILMKVADWSPCKGMHGRVSIMALVTTEDALSVNVINSQNPSLADCATEVITNTSTGGVPSDYFMMSAELEFH